MSENDKDDEDLCINCRHNRIGYTTMITGNIIPEQYCGLTKTQDYCCGEYYEEDE